MKKKITRIWGVGLVIVMLVALVAFALPIMATAPAEALAPAPASDISLVPVSAAVELPVVSSQVGSEALLLESDVGLAMATAPANAGLTMTAVDKFWAKNAGTVNAIGLGVILSLSVLMLVMVAPVHLIARRIMTLYRLTTRSPGFGGGAVLKYPV